MTFAQLKLPALLVVAALAMTASIVRTFAWQSVGPIAKDRDHATRHEPRAGAKPDERTVAGHGVVEPAEPEVHLSADVAGRLAAVHYKEGDHVVKGTVVAELDNGALKASLAGADANLAQAQAELQRTLRGMRVQDVHALVSDSLAARARASLAEDELRRAEGLSKNGAISQAELDRARTQYEAGKAEYAASTARSASAQAGSRQEDIFAAQARLRAAEARRDEANASLGRSIIYAPFDGEILRVKAKAGEYHNPLSGDPVVVLGDLSRTKVRVDVDEKDVARVRLGAAARIGATAYPGQTFPGKVVEIGRRMGRRRVRVDDPTDRVDVRVLEVVVELEGKPPLLPGLRVEASLDASGGA